MNKLEELYARRLVELKHKGEIAYWAYEQVKLRLAPKTYYCPDFMVINVDGTVDFHEVKGFMRDDAAVKLKVAAVQFPYIGFYLVKRNAADTGWDITEISKDKVS